MWPGAHARRTPDKPAYRMGASGEVVTYAELDAASNRLAQLLHARGLRFGDHVALCVENSPRFLEICWAAQRSGLTYTPINSHLTGEEIAYIVGDCDAKAFITSAAHATTADALLARLPETVRTRLVIGGSLAGCERYEEVVAAHPATPLAEEIEGSPMLYSPARPGGRRGLPTRTRASPSARRSRPSTGSPVCTDSRPTRCTSRPRPSTTPPRSTSA